MWKYLSVPAHKIVTGYENSERRNLLFRLLFTAVLIITPSLVRLDCLIIAVDFTMGLPVRVGVVLPREK
jgi:hypothetical protein